jgi:CRISPR system Cascade subunit CasE
VQQLALDTLEIGKRFRFRLRANPSTSCQGKRQGLLKLIDQEQWLVRKGTLHGFELPTATSFGFENNAVDIIVSQSQMLRSCQRNGCPITIFSAQYDGILAVTDIEKFCTALETGIGHGKMMGLGLLSVVPLR